MVVMVCQIDVGAQPAGSHLSVYHNRCLFVISVGGWTSGSVSCTKTCSVSLIKHLLSYIRYIFDQMAFIMPTENGNRMLFLTGCFQWQHRRI